MGIRIQAVSPAGIHLIKQFEGCRLQAYLCPAGKLTIGYGHVLLPMDYALFKVPMARMGEIIKINQAGKPGQPVKIPLHINPAQADSLLARDTANTARFLASVTRTALTQWQFDALCSFILNVGQGNYAQSTLRRLIDAGELDAAAAEFGRWVYATVNGNKVKLDGLVKRRAAERDLFLGWDDASE